MKSFEISSCQPVILSLCSPPRRISADLTAERWQSGRMHRTRNAAYLQGYRGFKSHPLRHFPQLAALLWFSLTPAAEPVLVTSRIQRVKCARRPCSRRPRELHAEWHRSRQHACASRTILVIASRRYQDASMPSDRPDRGLHPCCRSRPRQ